jgi:hypothetical protein
MSDLLRTDDHAVKARAPLEQLPPPAKSRPIYSPAALRHRQSSSTALPSWGACVSVAEASHF